MRLSSILLLVVILIGSSSQSSAQSLLDSLKGTIDGALGSSAGEATSLTDEQIKDGLLEALKVGTERVVGQLGAVDGYNLDPEIHIPLPDNLVTVQNTLKKVGLSGMADDLEIKINRAAEAAAPEAKTLFWDTISQMSFADVRNIYEGPDDAATRYFQDRMTPSLAEQMKPIVDRTLSQVGAIKAYDQMMGQYTSIPFVPDVKTDLTAYSVEQAMAGLFHYVALEEAAIRNNSTARTTQILKTVFGQ